MDIEILYVPDCPNLGQARRHVDTAVRAAAVSASVHEVEVADAATAARVGMCGSPTVVIDGRDAVTSDGSMGSMSCRLYTVGGVPQGAPSVEQLVEALRR